MITSKIQEIQPLTFDYNVKQFKLLFTVGISNCNCKFFINKKAKLTLNLFYKIIAFYYRIKYKLMFIKNEQINKMNIY